MVYAIFMKSICLCNSIFRVYYEMDKYLHLKPHHSGEFIDEEFSVYEGGTIDDLKVEVDRWSYFELLGCFNELGYSDIEKIYHMDPTFGMNVLVDDKGALEIRMRGENVQVTKRHVQLQMGGENIYYYQRLF